MKAFKIILWIKENWLLVSIICLSFFFRFFHLTFNSVWLDEVHTLIESNPSFSFSEFLAELKGADPHPLLYFSLVKICFYVFGYTSVVARALSAVLGVAGVAAIYLLGKELYDKKAGLLAAFLICINPFHIHYSQEARPYILLFLFTVLSFYGLTKFLKKTSIRNSVTYGVLTGLMISSHFFGLMALISQIVILIGYFIIEENKSKIKLFVRMTISGGLSLAIFSLSLPLFIQATKITSFWIPIPKRDVFYKTFSEFFQHPESVVAIATLLLYFYLINVFKSSEKSLSKNQIVNDKLLFGFLIMMCWIVVSVWIPFIRSYTVVPMILSRYLIIVFPVPIIMISIGMRLIPNKYLRGVVVSCFTFFSLTHLFVIDDYYGSIKKSQFQPVTDLIKEKNTNNSTIITSLPWHFEYFFRDQMKVDNNYNSLDIYVDEMAKDTLYLQEFWYVDAHGRKFNPNEKTAKILDKHFIIKDEGNFYDAWTKHFVPVREGYFFRYDLSKIEPYQKPYGTNSIIVLGNRTFKTQRKKFKKGKYEILIKGVSHPAEAIDSINAHIRVLIDSTEIGEIYFDQYENVINLDVAQDRELELTIVYDNDIFKDNKDRNLAIDFIGVFNQ